MCCYLFSSLSLSTCGSVILQSFSLSQTSTTVDELFSLVISRPVFDWIWSRAFDTNSAWHFHSSERSMLNKLLHNAWTIDGQVMGVETPGGKLTLWHEQETFIAANHEELTGKKPDTAGFKCPTPPARAAHAYQQSAQPPIFDQNPYQPLQEDIEVEHSH